MPQPVDVEEVLALGRSAGLSAVGVAPATPFERARRALDDRKAAGLHDGMAFTYRNPARSTTPAGLVAGAQAIVVGARRYAPRAVEPADVGSGRRPRGRVARYARDDHYAPLRSALWTVAHHLRRHGWRAVVFADDNALVDREAAYRAGLGWYGKNANLLLPGQGSWFVLGSVVTDAPLAAHEAPQADGCGACRRCIDGCPTGAIIAEGVVDAARCLAWLVQRPGVFPRQFREALGDRIYGCDVCQEVCPPNRRTDRTDRAERADRSGRDSTALAGPGRDVGGGGEADGVEGRVGGSVDLLELLAADDATLLARHGRWYLANREPRWLRRNALVALGNAGRADDPEVEATLRRYLTATDPMLRAHAVWAVARLGRDDVLAEIHVASDPDPDVQAELAAAASV